MKTLKRYAVNNKGFSLIEAMIAVGISAVLSIGISHAIASSIEGASQVRSTRMADDLSDVVSGILVDSNYCGLIFKGITVPNNLGTIFAKDVSFKEMASSATLGSKTLFGAGTIYQNTLRVNSINGYLTTKLGPNRYLGELRLELVSSTGIMKNFVRNVTIFIDTDASNKIVSCGQSANMAALSKLYVPGQAYGYCKMDLNASFTITSASAAKYPVVTCPSSGALVAPTCAAGFSAIVNIQAQANSSGSSDFTTMPSNDARQVMARFSDGDIYFIGWQCIKD